MGYPINSLQYLLNEWDWISSQNPQGFYALLLYTQKHPGMVNFTAKYFRRLDVWAKPNSQFFTIAPPPLRWKEKANKDIYWRHFMQDANRDIGYTDSTVEHVAQQFGLSVDRLPALILFRDIHTLEILIVELGRIQPQELAPLFRNLFALLNSKGVGNLPLRQLGQVADELPTNRGITAVEVDRAYLAAVDVLAGTTMLMTSGMVGAALTGKLHSFVLGLTLFFRGHRAKPEPLGAAKYIETTDSPQVMLRKLGDDIAQLKNEVATLRAELQAGFETVHLGLNKIHSQLSQVSDNIAGFREFFISKLDTLENRESSVLVRETARLKLHRRFDEFLVIQAQRIAETLDRQKPPVLTRSLASSWNGLLEGESRTNLLTAELVWQHMEQTTPLADIDFSVCGVGLWKALEFELNRTFIDALRVHHGLCKPGTPSIYQQPLHAGRVNEKGLWNGRQTEVRLDCLHRDTLMGIELVKISSLLSNNTTNSFAQILVHINPTGSNSLPKAMRDLAIAIQKTAFYYRNSFAHMQPMDYEICRSLRAYMFEQDDSPLRVTLQFKKQFLKKKLI